MNKQPARALVQPDPRVVLVDGFGYKVTVRNDMLCVTQNGAEVTYPKASASKSGNGVARLIIVSDDGYVTGRAFAWLRRNDVPVIQCNREGNSSFASGNSSDGRMARLQVMAQQDMPNAATGLEIARRILTEKAEGQLRILKNLGTEDVTRHTEIIADMQLARTIRSLMAFEGNASRAYFKEWESRVSVPWRKSALKKVPQHWQRFNGRSSDSQSSGRGQASSRGAIDLVNAMLNLAYKFAENECNIACSAFGLHNGIGIFHGQVHDAMPAMSLDILETCRAASDEVVLSYMKCDDSAHPMGDDGRLFYWTDKAAMEADGGICRLGKESVYKLAAAVSMKTAPIAMQWAAYVANSITRSKHPVEVPFDPRIHARVPRLDISDDLTAADIIPDEMWLRVQPLMPAFVTGNRYKADDRRTMAAVILHEVYGVAWGPKNYDASRFCNWQTARKRLDFLKSSGAWSAIRAEINHPARV